MKIGWGLLWALALAILLAPFARADVCAKAAPRTRIKIIELEGGRMKFVSCYKGKTEVCKPIGPKDESYTMEELSKGRDEIHALRAGARAGDTAGGFMALFLIVTVVDMGDAGTAARESNKERAKAVWLDRQYQTLAPELLSSDESCHNVRSITSHRSALEAALKQVVKVRVAESKSEIPAEKLEEKIDSKAPLPDQDKSPLPTTPPDSGQKPTG